MSNYRLSVVSIFFIFIIAAQAQIEVGQWRDHLPYVSTVAVTEGDDHFFCAAEDALFSYSKSDGVVEKLSKVNALSDIGVSTIRYNNYNDVLVVGYTNGNLDLIKENTTINLADIKRNTGIVGNKIINHIYFVNELAYLSTGFGIVVINTDREEVSDTYSVLPALGDLSVNAVTTDANYIYAATNSGLFVANVNSPFLGDFNQWTQRTDFVTTTVTNGSFNDIVNFNGTIYINYDGATWQSDTCYYDEGSGWQPFTELAGNENYALEVSHNQLVVTHYGNVQRYNDARTLLEDIFAFNSSQYFLSRHAVFSSDGFTYIATANFGLLKAWNSWGNSYNIIPPGPPKNKVHAMDSKGDHLWVATGSVDGNPWNIDYAGVDGAYRFRDEEWDYFNNQTDPVNLPIPDIIDFLEICVDPDDDEHVYLTSWTGGVIELNGDAVTNVFDDSNSSLQPWNGVTGRVGVAGVDFDSEGNAWFSNSSATYPFVARDPDGNWYSFGSGTTASNEVLSQVLVTQNDDVWILKPFVGGYGGIQCLDYNGTLSNSGDDELKFLDGNQGSGNLPSTTLYCMAEDLDGEIWVGTSEGVAVFYSPSNVFSGGNYDAQQILLEQDGNLQILLETENVISIAVDGANRKWFGTRGGGVYLMSEDGTEQVHHFTTENSPLLSDEVVAITINSITGEVFFGTAAGIVSYRGTAIEGAASYSNAYAFPNPVREDYLGLISITGLLAESDVKITDVAGNLVYTTTSDGGQATWDGNDLFGMRVKSGVYLVFATDPTGDFATVTKILVMGQE